jgi:hypothetical protein
VADNSPNQPGTIEQHRESCASGGVCDGAALATLWLGIDIARDANRGLYTLRPHAPMLLPARHKFGTAANDPRYYQPGKHATCARTHAFVHANVNATRTPPDVL